MVVCIIPARGGSKRIKNKNIKNFAGKPLIAWTILAAQKSNLFKRIIVSTECEIIAKEAQKYIKIPFIREKYYDDYSNITNVALHVIEQCKQHLNEEYENIAILQPTSPFRTATDINNTYKYYNDNDLSSVISCFKPQFVNPWWLAEIDKFNKPRKVFNEQMKRSQDYSELYCPSGAVMFVKVKHLMKYKNIHDDISYYPINWLNAIDIDCSEEFEYAELIFNKVKIH